MALSYAQQADFDLNGQRVDARTANFVGRPGDLALGKTVVVDGATAGRGGVRPAVPGHRPDQHEEGDEDAEGRAGPMQEGVEILRRVLSGPSLPQVLVSLDDLKASGLLAFGSRARSMRGRRAPGWPRSAWAEWR